MRLRFNTLVCLLLAVISIPACEGDRIADPPGPESPELPTASASTLSGRLVNPATQLPVVGASITYGDAATTSGPDGGFELTDLVPGTATLRSTAIGFEDFELSVTVPYEGFLLFYQNRIPFQEFGDFTLYVPPGVVTVRGVLLALGGPDTRAFGSAGTFGAPVPEVENALQTLGTRLREVAAERGLAVVGTSHAAMANEAASDDLLAGALAEAAALSGRPEIATAPVLLYGMSGGAPQASGFAARHPERTIGLILKVPAGVELLDGDAARGVPTLVILAENDAFVDNAAIVERFAANRRAGALWALATERAVPHHSLSPRQRELTIHWLGDILYRRFHEAPAGTMNAISESSGWLGDPGTGQVATPDAFADPGAASWLPTWDTAHRWDALGRAMNPTVPTIRLVGTLDVRVGLEGSIVAWVRDQTGALIYYPPVAFASERDDVALVSRLDCTWGNWLCDGAYASVTAIAEGTTRVTASYQQEVAAVTVTVRP